MYENDSYLIYMYIVNGRKQIQADTPGADNLRRNTDMKHAIKTK